MSDKRQDAILARRNFEDTLKMLQDYYRQMVKLEAFEWDVLPDNHVKLENFSEITLYNDTPIFYEIERHSGDQRKHRKGKVRVCVNINWSEEEWTEKNLKKL